MSAENPKPRILYVEDAGLMQVIIAENLKKHYEVFPAKDGLDALEKMADEEFDAVLLDMNMPVLNGYMFLGIVRGTYNLLRQEEREKINAMQEGCVKKALSGCYKNTPVIVMSTEGERNGARIMEFGADEVISKPYQSKKLALIEAIEGALEKKKANKPFSDESE